MSRPAEAAAERLQKVMAAAGLGSRRALESRIRAGEVLVDGQPAELGQRVGAGATVSLDDRHFRVQPADEPSRVLMYNKPEGEICTRSDPEGRPTVFDRLPALKRGRWIGIGRLDINTSGLLLLTDDGELANAMMHPSGGVDREYACRIHGHVSPDALAQVTQGVQLEDGPARFSDVVDSGGSGGNRWFHVVLMEGRNREVRRIWEAVGVQVSRLKRVRYGAVILPSRVKVRQWEELSPADVAVLREDVGLSSRPAAGLKLVPLQKRHARTAKKSSRRRAR